MWAICWSFGQDVKKKLVKKGLMSTFMFVPTSNSASKLEKRSAQNQILTLKFRFEDLKAELFRFKL